MKISVIVAYHGEENYVRDCLDSLKQQAFQDFEVLLICDGCEAPDVSSYSELTISLLETKNQSGVATARNIGIENAKGEYLFFLDADDYLRMHLRSCLPMQKTLV